MMKLSLDKATYIFKLIAIILLIISVNTKLCAQSLTDELNQAEQLAAQDIEAADEKLRNLEAKVIQGQNKEKLRWLMLTLNITANQFDLARLAEIKARTPALLATFTNTKAIWLTLIELTIELVQEKPTLKQFQAIEEQVESFNDPFISAFFYRSLFYSFFNSNIIDVALDIAIKNQKQWLALEEFYLALEMQYNITRIRVNIMRDPQSKKLITELANSAQATNAVIYNASLTELKANWLIQQGKQLQAYNLLSDLLQQTKLPLAKSRRLSTLYSLAAITFQLKKYDETIEFTQKILSQNTAQSQQSIDNTKVILARALIEQGDFAEAGRLVAEIEQNIKADNIFLKFQIDNIKIDMLYKSRNIDALYQTTKSMIANITAPATDEHIGRRIARANKAAHVEEQSKVVEALAEDNIIQKEEIDFNKQLIAAKDQYLLILSIFCLFLIGLFIWLMLLLKKINVLANIDGLTGISNRRHGMIQADKSFKHFINSSQSGACAIVIMDLDFFKKINDTYGHAIGDKVIKLTVKTTQKYLTDADVFCRMGGEEFLLVISAQEQQAIKAKLNEIRAGLTDVNASKLGMDSPITASFGVTFVTSSGKILSDYIIEADNALYQAKEDGRNQISCFTA
ncbi:GGDEF domain-containing protein [Colwelliaceae bacterium MEBiC 14330]